MTPVVEDLDLQEDIELIESDGEPLETEWHVNAMHLLMAVARWHNRKRKDVYVGGNMFIYYKDPQHGKKKFRGPDFFLVWGVPSMPLRPYWVVWEEGRFPDCIIELLSPKTAKVDRTVKKDTYEKIFKTHEFFLYDPRTQGLEGWRLTRAKYQAIRPNSQGWLWSEELGLWLGTWKGKYEEREAVWLRFYDTKGRLVPDFAEAERKRAEAERQRAEAAEAELARLKAQLRKNSKPNGKNQ